MPESLPESLARDQLHPTRKKPEVMSPAGYWPQLQAAVEAGADSVYFGLRHFSARAKVGFGLQELPNVMRTLHSRGVRGFITFNTLIFDKELRAAADAIAQIAEAGADALIVQDWAVLALAQRIAPQLELHASTQMSITDTPGARLAMQLGVSRVTLARELSLKEIASIAAAVPIEMEVFVHGALCVAYSGQCFSSEAWGGRSANRGQCAQACRMPYEMVVDGKLTPLGDARYLLSPEDLYALAQVPELVAAGVGALKIEGRYKESDYVAAATKAYRAAVDSAWAGRPAAPSPEEELLLRQVYSRGMGPHFLTGTNHQKVVRGESPRHRGLLMGTVLEVNRENVLVALEPAHQISPLKPGDGVVFDASAWRSPQEPEEGGRIYQANPAGKLRLRLHFGQNDLDFGRIRQGDRLWRTDDPAVEKLLKPWTEATAPVTRQPLRVHMTAKPGQPLRMRWSLLQRPEVSIDVESPAPLAEAQNRTLSPEDLRAQVDRLGGTPYRLEEFEFTSEGRPFLPVSSLNDLRRQAVEALSHMQADAPGAPVVTDPFAALATLRPKAATPQALQQLPRLHLLLRTPEQLDAALALGPELGVDSLTLDYLDLYGLKPSVERVKQAGRTVRVATPRILKPGEERIADFLLRLDAPLLVRSSGLLQRMRSESSQALFGDFSLNAANAITASQLLEMGLTRLTPTHDLNAAQVEALARQIGGHCLEVIAYQHLPVFHMEHCVFCRFLSTGTTFEDCGRPCEKHKLELQDTQGRTHPVLADIGCRNTVFGAQAQEASLHLERWLKVGIADFRLEFAHETGEQVRQITEAFAEALQDGLDGGQVHEKVLQARLRTATPQGITQGSLFVPTHDARLPILQ